MYQSRRNDILTDMATIAACVLILFLLYCIARLLQGVMAGGDGRPLYSQLFRLLLWGISIFFAGRWAVGVMLRH